MRANKNSVMNLMTVFLIICFLSGCSAIPIKPDNSQVFDQPIDAVQNAAHDALSVTGFRVKKAEPFYIEGYRPRTWGFLCSPGGETAGIWLEQLGPSKTNVSVSTAISSFGALCQKDWTQMIYSEMNKTLSK